MTVEGVYENHHLLCPIHGRTVPMGDGRASCGCTPNIVWTCPGEDAMYPDDLMGIGVRFLRRD